MKPVVWGVISTAKIGRERVLPGMRKSKLLEIRAIASDAGASGASVRTHFPFPLDGPAPTPYMACPNSDQHCP
jgi:hypothetical protein